MVGAIKNVKLSHNHYSALVVISNDEIKNVLKVITILKDIHVYKVECRATRTPNENEGRITGGMESCSPAKL
jgi:hypothetical protein